MSSSIEGQGLLAEVMLSIFEWASKALIQAKPSGLRRRKWGSNSLTYLLISKGFWRPKASQWGGMIREDPRRNFFWSPIISAKLASDQRARRDDSNGFHFTSNGLRMRKLSRSVLWGQQAKFAKEVPRGTTDKVTRGIRTVLKWWHGMCTNQREDDMWMYRRMTCQPIQWYGPI